MALRVRDRVHEGQRGRPLLLAGELRHLHGFVEGGVLIVDAIVFVQIYGCFQLTRDGLEIDIVVFNLFIINLSE